MKDRPATRGNAKKIYKMRARTERRRNTFKIRVADLWNSLPETVASAPSLDTFKNRFDRLMEGQEIKYDNYRAEVRITWDHGSDMRTDESGGEAPME